MNSKNISEPSDDNHVVIVGGGLAGLSLAIQLKKQQPQLDITVIERERHPVSEAAHKVGESLVELSSHYFAEVLGLKQHLIEKQLPKLGLRFFFRPELNQPAEQRLENTVEFGANYFPTSPSFQLDRGIFENFLAEHCQKLGIRFIDDTKVVDIEINKNEKSHKIFAEHLSTGDKNEFSCRWLVDACSRKSPVKRKLNLAKESPHKVSAAWFRIEAKLDITELNTNKEWLDGHEGDHSRWFSTNHFMGEGYWLWFIPLSSGSTSIGIVADNKSHPLDTYNTMDKALAWLKKHEPLATTLVEDQLDLLQDFRVLKNFSHDAEQVFCTDRWFLTGEAGAFLDPFYSPGSDFIGMSNTFISHLIDTDINDTESFAINCLKLDIFYLNLFRKTMLIYQDLYSIFKHPVVMPIKILWDFSVYWSFTAFLFIQDQLSTTDSVFKLRKYFEDIGSMNEHLQSLLIAWGEVEEPIANTMYIDPFEISFLKELNEGLAQEFDNYDDFKEKFLENLEGLKSLYQLICQQIYQRFPELEEKIMPSEIYGETFPENSASEEINKLFDALIVTATNKSNSNVS